MSLFDEISNNDNFESKTVFNFKVEQSERCDRTDDECMIPFKLDEIQLFGEFRERYLRIKQKKDLIFRKDLTSD
jgi:hypothetical protein